MFWKRRDTFGARVGNWKWTVMGDNQQGLFDLATDVGESKDLSATHPDKMKELIDAYSGWLEEMDAAEPRGPFRNF